MINALSRLLTGLFLLILAAALLSCAVRTARPTDHPAIWRVKK